MIRFYPMKDYLKNGTSLRKDGYVITGEMERMTREELIEEILSTHSHDYLVENNFIKKIPRCGDCGREAVIAGPARNFCERCIEAYE